MKTSPTYARARLRLGITAVGTFVVLAAGALVLHAPARILDGVGGTAGADAVALAAVMGLAALVALPYDVLGGFVLPRRHGRPHPAPTRFLAGWARGVAVLLGVSVASGTLLLAAGRAGGRPAALVAFLALTALLLVLQEPLARLVGGLRRVRGARGVIVLEGDDPGFSGGFAGPRAIPVLPARWERLLEPRALALLLERRAAIRASGAWSRGLALALAWNGLGFGLASFLPGAGVSAVSELVTTALGFTLWTFLGLLLLPTPSRRATVAADARVVADEGSRAALAAAVETLDALQDDEPERAPGVEAVFHPVPSVRNRLRSLAGARGPRARGPGAWHVARTALYLSHAGLSLLPRAVHCNAGRPELWVYLPADG